MTKLQSWSVGACGAIGSFIAQLLGGWTSDLQTLLIFMSVDFVMGLIIAGVLNKSTKTETGALNSSAGFKGLCKKGFTLLIVLVANQLDSVMGVEYIRTAVIIAFIVNETISIVENAGIMGIPIPSVLTKAIDILKTKSEESDGEKNE